MSTKITVGSGKDYHLYRELFEEDGVDPESDLYKLIAGALVGQLRARRDLTQADLAARVGETQSAVSRMEMGLARIDVTHLRAFAGEFETTPGQLLDAVVDAHARALKIADGQLDVGWTGLGGLAQFAVSVTLAVLGGKPGSSR